MLDDLAPDDFAETAVAAVADCAGRDDVKARARILAEAGLLAVTAPEDVGGLALPLDFAVPICAAAGSGLLGYPIIETLLLSKALADVDPDLAGRIASGDTLATIAWQGVAEDGVVGAAPMAMAADAILILCADGSAVLSRVGNAVQPEDSPSFDVDAPDALVRVSGPLDGPQIPAETIDRLKAEATIMRAAYIQGAASQCLATAADYAQERAQFGKPLSANQVLRHRLSRDALAVETMKNGLSRALATAGAEGDMAREALWLCAAQSGPEVAESAIQVFGGMGFTWDVPLHRHLRQIRAQTVYGAALERGDAFAASVVNSTDNEWYGRLPQ